MVRSFEIPQYYSSPVVSLIKIARKREDQRKTDLTPSLLDLGIIRLKVARHFGFCFGVENAIEIAYRAINENPSKRVFLLSEMIHNPHVNKDLVDRGVRFLMDTDGSRRISFDELKPDDIVIVPAFGTTRELFLELQRHGVNPRLYDATCPFVEKVWKRADQLGKRGFSIIIHGKQSHEETRATFSHARLSGPSLVIKDKKEALQLSEYLRGDKSYDGFSDDFKDRFSPEFQPERDLVRIGVVNQTTMLASETQEISAMLRDAMKCRYGEVTLSEHFADTRDTLCYATSENQEATKGLIAAGGDLAIVVGGYNSSNTSHLVELCEERLPTFYIKDCGEILSKNEIRHLDLRTNAVRITKSWLPNKGTTPVEILVTAGASCPDAQVDSVITKIAQIYDVSEKLPQAMKPFEMAAHSGPSED